MIATFLISAMILSEATPLVVAVPKVDVVGDCVAAKGHSVDLRKLMFLENRSLDIESGGVVRVTLKGERVQMERLGPKSDGGIYSTNIGDEVKPDDDLDLELKLALMLGEPVLYWKETYQHRIYQQGLFRFVGDRVETLCQGKGGVNSSD